MARLPDRSCNFPRLFGLVFAVGLSACQSAPDNSAGSDVHTLGPAGAPESNRPLASDVELTRTSAARMSTAELAQRLLDSDSARRMSEHELPQDDPLFPGGHLRGVTFFARPAPYGTDLCRRAALYVALTPAGGRSEESLRADVPVVRERVIEQSQVALAPDCRLERGGGFGWVQLAPFEEAASALRRLSGFRQRAMAAGPIDAEVRCTSELAQNPCAGNARAALAGLPLHQVYFIQPLAGDGRRRPVTGNNRRGWEFTVTPRGPGQLFWKVEMEEPPGAPPVIRLHWGIPAPY